MAAGVLRAMFICLGVFVGVRMFLMVRAGELRIGQVGGTPLPINRRSNPVRFWSFVAFFYTVLIGIILFVAFIAGAH